MSPDEQVFDSFLARYEFGDSLMPEVGTHPISWLGQVSAAILRGQEGPVAFEWAKRMRVQLRRLRAEVPFRAVHYWQLQVMKSLPRGTNMGEESFASAYERVEVLHRQALDGGRAEEAEWFACLKPLLYEIYYGSYSYRKVLDESYAEAMEEVISSGTEEEQAKEISRHFAETNASLNALAFAEANARANAQALAAAYSSADPEAYAWTMPFARINAYARSYAGHDHAGQALPVSDVFYRTLADGLTASLEWCG